MVSNLKSIHELPLLETPNEALLEELRSGVHHDRATNEDRLDEDEEGPDMVLEEVGACHSADELVRLVCPQLGDKLHVFRLLIPLFIIIPSIKLPN